MNRGRTKRGSQARQAVVFRLPKAAVALVEGRCDVASAEAKAAMWIITGEGGPVYEVCQQTGDAHGALADYGSPRLRPVEDNEALERCEGAGRERFLLACTPMGLPS